MLEEESRSLFIVCATNAVVELLQRVLVVQYLAQTLCSCVARYVVLIGQAEASVEVEYYLLGYECLAAIGHIGCSCQVLRAHVLVPYTIIECKQQVLLLGCALHHTRVGQDDGLVLVAACHAVDHDAVQHTRLQILLLYVDVRSWYAVVEYSFWYLHLRTLLLHTQQQAIEVLIGPRTHYILEVERHSCHQY